MNLNVIYILWLRQVKKYYRSRARIVASLGQPVLFLVALGFGFGPIYQKAGAGNYIQFLVPGIICMSIIFTALFSGIEVIFDKQFGFLKEMLVAPVSRLEIMIGRTLGGASVAVFQGFLVLIISYIAGFRVQNLYLLPLALMFMFLTAVIFAALGTAIASKLEDMHGFQLISNFLVMPLFFLSGALFPLQSLPEALKIVTALDPLSYGVDGLRFSLTGVSHYSFQFDLLILLVIASILMAIGSYLFTKIQS